MGVLGSQAFESVADGGEVAGLKLAVAAGNTAVAEQHASPVAELLVDEHGAEPGSGAADTERLAGSAIPEQRHIPQVVLPDEGHSASLCGPDEGEPQPSAPELSAEEQRTGGTTKYSRLA